MRNSFFRVAKNFAVMDEMYITKDNVQSGNLQGGLQGTRGGVGTWENGRLIRMR